MSEFEKKFPEPKFLIPMNTMDTERMLDSDRYIWLRRREGWLEALKWILDKGEGEMFDLVFDVENEIKRLEKELQ